MATPVVLPGLKLVPLSTGVQFTAGAALRPASQSGQNLRLTRSMSSIQLNSNRHNSAKSVEMDVADPTLSVIDVERKLREKVSSNYRNIQQGFQNYDIDLSLSITKGEFRRILENFCFPMTTDQFQTILNKVATNPNGTVKYCDFLDKFYERDGRTDKKLNGLKRAEVTTPQDISVEMIERMLRDKIQSNQKSVMKALRLYDYNRDGHIQRHELRKVLENFCFKMSDAQFDKLYQRYDFQHKGGLNYRVFLQNLGLNVENSSKFSADSLHPSPQWPAEQVQKFGVLGRPEESKIAHLPLEEVEIEFRKKMHDNFATLKRMLMVFDKHMDGFVLIEDLKAAIDQFVMKLPYKVFTQLMTRLHVKASGKVSWEAFLAKFQDPSSHGNGQTLPIKASHKFFPIRGTQETKDIKEVIHLLHDHVTNGYSSFKEAFLQIDKTRKGWISRRELRKILNSFKFRMTTDQFQELMMLLDPGNTNCISYHKFLDLFEEKESKDAHKWLVSSHRFNEAEKPAILAWKTVEDLLKDKVIQQWKEVSQLIIKYDKSKSGKIDRKNLRKILNKVSVPLSNDHFNHLLSVVEDKSESGMVNYIEFFTNLGVTIKPGDLEGLSTQIITGSEEAENRRNADLANRARLVDDYFLDRSEQMSLDEIRVRLSDRLAQHTPQLYKIFHQYATKGKISKKNFRQMLERLGFRMLDEQFRQFCSSLTFHNSHMMYSDFISNFSDPRFGGPAPSILRINNHRVNPIRGDEIGMTAEVAESRLLQKLRENFGNLRAAFYKFDDDHNGIVTKENFRHMLDYFMCNLDNAEFERFCKRMGIDKKTKISYQDFLAAFELQDTEEGHKWLISNHRFHDVPNMRLMTAEEVYEQLHQKAHRQYKDLAKAFRSMDVSRNGLITKSDLRNCLYNFMMPMNKQEFNKLWLKLDVNAQGTISYQDFLRNVGGDAFAPGDILGISHHITQNNDEAIERHLQQQQNIQEQITANQIKRSEVIRPEDIIQELKDKIRDKYCDFATAFKAFDKKQRGFLTAASIQQVLVHFSFYLDDDQFYDLLEKINLSKPRTRMSYEQFLKVFEEGHVTHYPRAPEDPKYPQILNANLEINRAKDKLWRNITDNIEIISNALQVFDSQSTGKIPLADFRRLLDNFCFKMTDSQFKHLMESIPVDDNGLVDYTTFMTSFKDPNLENDPGLDFIPGHSPPATPQYLSPEDVDQRIREIVTARYREISRAMTEIDYARMGVLTKDDFREVLHKFSIHLSQEQFESLITRLKVNEFDNVDYQNFLRKFSAENIPRPSTTGGVPGTAGRPQTSDSLSRPFTPLVNAEDTEQKLMSKINRHWRDIQKYCRQADPDNTGQITQRDFKSIIGNFTLNLSEDDIRKLLLKYDINNNGTFCYRDFLRHFVLHMQSDNSQTLLTRRKPQSSDRLVVSAEETLETSTSKRLHQCVTLRWKQMLKNFREFDPNALGIVKSDDFHQVLRNFNINMSEEEFSHLIGRHVNQGSCLISYNDFIKEFLKP